MLTISKPLSAAQARTYHAEEFSNARDNYYTMGDQVAGQWHGRLAEQWGLRGAVSEAHFQRLADGRHPVTDELLVRHQTACQYTNARGERIKAMEHRAAWDATFSAPKSVSLTALVGGDERVREAHRASVAVALDEVERYLQARLGGRLPAETTGRWVAARFEHDSARPVAGYAAPQLHTHVVFFNLTHTASGEIPSTATAGALSDAAVRDRGLSLRAGPAPSRPRIRNRARGEWTTGNPRLYAGVSGGLEPAPHQRIQAHLEQHQRHGAGAAQIAAHQTREAKLDRTHDEVQLAHREMAAAFGDQAAHVVRKAHERVQVPEDLSPRITPRTAVTFGKERNLEREAVVDERAVLRDALTRWDG